MTTQTTRQKKMYWLGKLNRKGYAYDALFRRRSDAIEYGHPKPVKVYIEFAND